MHIAPLAGTFGAEIDDLDLSQGFDDDLMRELVAALHEHRLIVIRDQKLDKEQYLAFGRQWGQPIPHVLDHLRMPGYPEMMEVGNTREKDKEDTVRLGAGFWHTDQSYEAEPATATMLYAIEVPEEGGETMLADGRAAYEALDEVTKQRLEGLLGLHFYGAASGTDGENIAAPIVNAEQESKLPPVRHLIARPHPVTGVKVLFAVAGTPYGIAGMEEDEALALLEMLKTHMLQDRFIYKHKYRVGDIAIWDTSATLHSAVPIDVASSRADSRLLYRISVRGLPGVCR